MELIERPRGEICVIFLPNAILDSRASEPGNLIEARRSNSLPTCFLTEIHNPYAYVSVLFAVYELSSL